MKKIKIIRPRFDANHPISEALAQGFRLHGVEVEIIPNVAFVGNERTVACWGWRLGEQLRRRGFTVLVIEHGYIGDRMEWLSLSWNGLNNRATWPDHQLDLDARWDQHHAARLKPWNPCGEYVLLVGQVAGDMALQGRRLEGWYALTARACSRFYGLPVLFRPHPQEVRKRGHRPGQIPGLEYCPSAWDLEECISGARAVVTFNSNTATDAVLAGKPVVAFDQGCMAWDICQRGTFSNDTKEPDRLAWAKRIAGLQFNLDEIRQGVPVPGLLRAIGVA